ncbi:hypothetical protein D3877_05820 [Azospirillum cavernae]|uniref:SH3b domain-containing protein n=1 Tax=Azospirillum cavernae TaxID=2320860 RepID=A0A418W292_9PROT|nr:SH3 domain-containing protein [Azospirillum cavernae]RJF84121.1 hypothetical protein D3877_05820 [Azospirillum cavernae]
MSRPSSLSRASSVAVIALTVGLLGVAVCNQAAAQTTRPAAPAPAAAEAVRLEPLTGDYVAVGRINLRQQPSQQGARIGQIDSGAKVVVTGKVVDSPWYAVTREDGRRGYVFADLLRPVDPPAVPAPSAPAAPTPVAEVAPMAPVPPPVPEAAPTPPPAPAVAPQPDPVAAALNERLNSMDSALADIRKQIGAGPAVKGLEERQQALESAIAALRNDVTGLRGAASEGDKPGGFLDRLMGLQDQISAQIAEQKADLKSLAKRLDEAEEWLKPVKEWTDKTISDMRPPVGWMEWLMSGPTAAWSWLSNGWWWQPPAAPAATGTSVAPVSPLRLPDSPPPARSTIMG